MSAGDKDRAARALKAMTDFGLDDKVVKPVLLDLFSLYDENWEFIEGENYRVLLDACYESMEGKGVENKGKGMNERDRVASKRPVKKPNLGVAAKDEDSSMRDSDSRKLTFPEASRQSLMDDRGEAKQSAQICSQANGSASRAADLKRRVDKAGSAFGKRENESSDHLKKESIEPKAELENTAYLKKRENESGPSNRRKENKPNGNRKRELITPNTDQPITDLTLKPDTNRIGDITNGMEKIKISLVNDYGKVDPPKFTYMPQNLIYQNAHVIISLTRIADDDCCLSCKGDCLAAPTPCACTRETQGEFAYTSQGLLREKFLETCISMRKEPKAEHFVYCQDCPLQKTNNDLVPGQCEGHLLRKFIKECWIKCGCNMSCGNRVVQRGVSQKLQVFMTRESKGWGVRPLHSLPKGSFVCEYVGEILTNSELYERNMRSSGNERHTYPVTLDADWGSEKNLRDEDALCLDATNFGNVARFINHRCHDGNLIDIPVQVETPDRHYYHLAFFTTREVQALEELTWDYGIDFEDHNHPVKAFRCTCGSNYCRDSTSKLGIEL